MFRGAYEHASKFTAPVVVSQRFHTGEVECSVGAAIVLNDQGWIATARHMLEPVQLYQQHQAEIAAYESEKTKIIGGPGTEKGKQKRIRALAHGKRWITNYSYWWGIDAWSVSQLEILTEADLALGKLDGFAPAHVLDYPVFEKGAAIRPGASVCRLGFPFHNIGATYDRAQDRFTLAPESLPIPRFPNEGMVTRILEGGPAADGTNVLMLETSTPGLRGQSGGPLFDVDGRIWGMQSRTHHLPLGFSPETEQAGKKVVEHQFINLGISIHSDTIIEFARKHGVSITVT